MGGSHVPSLTEEGRAFLQRRTALFGLIAGGVGLGFWLLGGAQLVAAGGPSGLAQPHMLAHLIGWLLMIALWLANRTGVRSARFIYGSEHLCFVTSCIAYSTMVAVVPQVFRPEITLLLIFSLVSLARAIFLPSTWWRTAILSAVLGVELVYVTLRVYGEMDPALEATFASVVPAGGVPPRYGLMINVLSWWVAMSVVASSASAVIYGLRRDMSRARQLGQYTLVRKIGEGGMGMVFEANHAMLRRPTAVKLLLPERVGEKSIARFEREVRATAALSHPNTITVFDFGRTPDGLFYYAMEYVEGGTLSDVVALEGPLPAGRVVFILHQVAGALAEAHRAGLIHRDIKPDNVLLTQAGWLSDLVKVVDFGLVKELGEGDTGVTQENQIVGTPQYLAPEIIRGAHAADVASDLYALGCVAYVLLTGDHVFGGATIVEVCAKHLSEAPTPLAEHGVELSEPLGALVMSCLEKDPVHRPASADALQTRLEALPEFGHWTRADAERWWRELGPDLASAREGKSFGSADTRALAIDLGRRS